MYSPTRGCYWNKCTFCDYGLNTDRPTAPSRERAPELLKRDLARIGEFARTMYFAVDAMSPVYIRKLTDVMVALPTPLRWAAELRLERNFPKRKLGTRLKESGCVAISFGYESGSQRILDLIDKGIRIGEVPLVLEELRGAGIGAQMMGFVGFPSETEQEALDTFEFLQGHSDDWTLAGIGDFALTSGAIIARAPERFGIRVTPPPDGSDLQRILPWAWNNGGGGSGTPRSDRVDQAARSIRRFPDDRPFVGGIDSAHSLLYFGAYGRQLTPCNGRDQSGPIDPGVLYESPLHSVHEYTTTSDVGQARVQSSLAAAQPGIKWNFEAWLSETPRAASDTGGSTIRVLASGELLHARSLSSRVSGEGPAGRLAQLLLEGSGAA